MNINFCKKKTSVADCFVVLFFLSIYFLSQLHAEMESDDPEEQETEDRIVGGFTVVPDKTVVKKRKVRNFHQI